VTIEEQAKAIEELYTQFHRITTQPWRTEQDRREALQTLKGHLTAADRTLRLPPSSSDTAGRPSKLILWSEMTRGTLKEMGQEVVVTDTSH
jgi:hypothetical protein